MFNTERFLDKLCVEFPIQAAWIDDDGLVHVEFFKDGEIEEIYGEVNDSTMPNFVAACIYHMGIPVCH